MSLKLFIRSVKNSVVGVGDKKNKEEKEEKKKMPPNYEQAFPHRSAHFSILMHCNLHLS